ncbi:MAG: hypothetical protein ACE5QV_02805, partial [Fidelibacterota bacterium]
MQTTRVNFQNYRYNYFIASLTLIFKLAYFTANLHAQSYLSNLTATKDDPIFTTYAAPLSRSEFIVDEGYQFKFFQDDNGINFETDKGGYLSMVFKLNGEVRYLLNQMHTQPVITTSYSDLVKYWYQPFEGVQVDAFFQVYSSRIAIHQIKITNNTNSEVELSIYPFLQHNKGITDVWISSDHRYFTFSHGEYPDWWTIAHGVPFEDSLANVYLFSELPDAYGAYNELGKLSYHPTSYHTQLQVLSNEDYCVEWGTVHHADGTLCTHKPPDAQLIIFHNGSTGEILTEDALRWGADEPNIPGNVYQAVELGNFRHPEIAVGDSFTVIFTCSATQQQGIVSGIISQLPAVGGIRTDIQLTQSGYPETPRSVGIHFSLNYASAFIFWEQLPGYLYNVYRRTGSIPGRYDLIADNLSSPGYLDIGLDPDSIYAYVVIARDSTGRFSGHSKEVGSFGRRDFFKDVYNQSLYNYIPSANIKVVAFQKSFSLEPGESRILRIIRGVTKKGSPLDSLFLIYQDLLNYNMDQVLIDNEQIYSRIPLVEFTDPDYEMMYWSAFSMMRQNMLPPEGESSYNYY